MIIPFSSFIRYSIVVCILGSILNIFCDPLINFNDDCDALRQEYISMDFSYGFPEDQVIESEVAGGLVTEEFLPGRVFFSTGPIGSLASLTTIKAVPANPNDEVYAIFSALFQRTTDASLQLVGLYDTNNGMAVGYVDIGGPFSILYRNDGVDTVVPQASFNVDPLDGTGPSGILLNTETFNTYRISFVWYGTNIVRYQVLNTNNEWVTFHEIENVNILPDAAFSNPYLPLRAEQANLGVVTADLLYVKGWKAAVIHSGETNAGIRTFDMQQTVTTASTAETYMFTIRDKSAFGGEANKVITKLRRIGGGNALNQTFPVIIRYYNNSTLTGAVFTDVNTDNSVMEVDTSATSFTSDHLIWTTGESGLIFETLPADELEFLLGPGKKSITVTAQKLDATSAPMYATAMWDEYQ